MPRHEAVGDAVARVGVLGDAHQPEAGERGGRLARHRVDVVGKLVAVKTSTVPDGAPRGLGEAESD
jgi:hypothetical protein